MEDWTEIRRLGRDEQVPIRAIARQLGISRNTVRAALRSDRPPTYNRAPTGSALDAYEDAIRTCLAIDPTMPATRIADRIDWTRSMTVLRDRLRVIRPEYAGPAPDPDAPAQPGDAMHWDLWLPDISIPVASGQRRHFPVLLATARYSRTTTALMLPSRLGGDILSGTWQLLLRAGGVAKSMVWDAEPGLGDGRTPTCQVTAFNRSLSSRLVLTPAHDPEHRRIRERNIWLLETLFLPDRTFVSPADFNAQIGQWWATVGNQRPVRALHARPSELWAEDLAAMGPLPPVSPKTGLHHRVRLVHGYHLPLDNNHYSADPRALSRYMDVHADLHTVRIQAGPDLVGHHRRCWGEGQFVTDATHAEVARRYQSHNGYVQAPGS